MNHLDSPKATEWSRCVSTVGERVERGDTSSQGSVFVSAGKNMPPPQSLSLRALTVIMACLCLQRRDNCLHLVVV